MSQENKYQGLWESRSSIRTRPRKVIDFTQEGDFFPANKQTLLWIPEVEVLAPAAKQTILIQSFYKYLNDIINLEVQLILSACNKIIYTDLPVHYSEATKLNAYTVIIDEYYHVYTARDMIIQLNNQFPELPKLEYPISDASSAVSTIKSRMDMQYWDMFEIIAVCIFETTLVRELVEFFNSPGVHPSVKYYVNDHMNDEAKHFGYFYELLCHTWHNLPEKYQSNIGPHLADFVKLYLHINSEKEFNTILLANVLGDTKKASTLVEEIYRGFDIDPNIPIVKNVLNVLRKSEILDNQYVAAGFQANELLEVIT